MEDFGLDIFTENYTKKIFILGMSERKRPIFNNLYHIEQTLYLKSHGQKYEININGINSNEKEILFKKVNNFSMQKESSCYVCEDEFEKPILLDMNVNILNSQMIDTIDNKEKQQLLLEIFDHTSNNDDYIILTNVFAITINPNAEYNQGGFVYNKKFFTKCSEKELSEILNFEKQKPNIGFEVTL